jgi:hypothetical protein
VDPRGELIGRQEHNRPRLGSSVGLRAACCGLAARTDPRWVALLTLCITAIAGLFALVGADSLWLAALGRIVANRGAVPAGVPFAAAATGHWPNTLVLAELIFHGMQAGLGNRGLLLAQLAAVALATIALTRDSLAAGATRQGTAAAVMLAALGALPSLSVIRVQLFSVALFPVLAALLRDQARAPSQCVWLVVPLLALWSNLHGAALIGLGMTLVYLAMVRLRQEPATAVGVGIAAVAAMCVTPAGIHTIAYYHGVLTNQAAQRGEGLWTPLSLAAPLDVLLILAAIALAARLRRIRPAAWELIVLLALAVMTIKASRSGVWLLLFLVPVAARTFQTRAFWDRLLPPLATVAMVGLVFAIVRGPAPSGASSELVDRALALSHGRAVLADDILAEQVALAGGRIVVGNPIDAFTRTEQDRYLDWLAGKPGGTRAIPSSVAVVLTRRSSPAQRLMSRDPAFHVAVEEGRALLFARDESVKLASVRPHRTPHRAAP